MVGVDENRYPGLQDFVSGRGPALSRAAYLLTGDHDAADDLVQSAVLRLLRHWKRVQDGDPEAYVRVIMYHLHVSWRRRRRVTEDLGAPPPDRSGADPHPGTLLRLSLDRALGRLSPRQRTVLVLRFYEDLSEEQVAQALGCSVGSVKRHVYNGLARLRAVFRPAE